jgi:hypothetical protein
MPADPKNTTPPAGEPSRQQMMRVLIPAGAIAVIVLLVAVLVASFDGDKGGDGKGKGNTKGADGADVTSGPGQPMPYDKSNGGTDDPDLKDIGGGMKIRDLKEGSGDPCPKGANVTVHYTGWTVNGNVFDSSKKAGKPFDCSLVPGSPRGVIAGWQKGIPEMKVGGIRKLVIPAALAYESRGAGKDIPPNATLIFEVELIKVN